MPDDNPIKYVPIKDLYQEPGAKELTESPEMEPYLNFAAALVQGHDPEPELEAIRQLPLEERYVWRVASALKWGFADLDETTAMNQASVATFIASTIISSICSVPTRAFKEQGHMHGPQLQQVHHPGEILWRQCVLVGADAQVKPVGRCIIGNRASALESGNGNSVQFEHKPINDIGRIYGDKGQQASHNAEKRTSSAGSTIRLHASRVSMGRGPLVSRKSGRRH